MLSSSINVSSKTFALIGAALLLLDYSATAVVSAATAMSYLDGEVALPFPIVVGSILIILLFATLCLGGVRDNARVAFAIILLHVSFLFPKPYSHRR